MAFLKIVNKKQNKKEKLINQDLRVLASLSFLEPLLIYFLNPTLVKSETLHNIVQNVGIM